MLESHDDTKYVPAKNTFVNYWTLLSCHCKYEMYAIVFQVHKHQVILGCKFIFGL